MTPARIGGLLQPTRALQWSNSGDKAAARRIVGEVRAAASHPFVDHHAAMVAESI